jgi:arginine/ornithine transport system permease protein
MFTQLADHLPSILHGAVLTIEVAFLSLFLSLLLGLAGALAKLSRNPLPRIIGTTYTTLIRGVPDLVLMMLFFYGGQILVNNFTDWLYATFKIDIFININEFVAGVLTIGFIYGAYMAETFRGAFISVERGQIEAAKAFGMNPRQVFMRILFPQMMRHAIPGIGNNWMVILKTTALVSIIGLEDMVKLAAEASKAEHMPFLFFIPVAVIYLLLTAISELGLKKLHTRYNVGHAS